MVSHLEVLLLWESAVMHSTYGLPLEHPMSHHHCHIALSTFHSCNTSQTILLNLGCLAHAANILDLPLWALMPHIMHPKLSASITIAQIPLACHESQHSDGLWDMKTLGCHHSSHLPGFWWITDRYDGGMKWALLPTSLNIHIFYVLKHHWQVLHVPMSNQTPRCQ